MTPHQLFRETTTRPRRSWPPYAWASVAGAAIAMFVSVTLLAWQASRERLHGHGDVTWPTIHAADFKAGCR
jgi:hypothetical protein